MKPTLKPHIRLHYRAPLDALQPGETPQWYASIHRHRTDSQFLQLPTPSIYATTWKYEVRTVLLLVRDILWRLKAAHWFVY
jgi:hypothetical protein